MPVTRAIGCLCAVMFLCLPADDVSPANVTVRAGVYPCEPIVTIGKDGSVSGVYVDVLDYIAEKEGWKLEYVIGSLDTCFARLDRGEIDFVVGPAWGDSLAARYDAPSEFLARERARIYVKDTKLLESLMELDGRRVAVMRGHWAVPFLRREIDRLGIECELVPYGDGHEAFAAVRRGEVDAALAGKFFGERHGNGYGLEGGRAIGGAVWRSFAFRRGGDRVLLEQIEKHMDAMKSYEKSVFVRAVHRHFGFEPPGGMPRWLLPLMRVLAAVVLVLIVVTLFLRMQVRRRTAELTIRNAELTAEIAGHRRTGAALQASELRFRTLFETSPLGIILLSIDGTVLEANDAAFAMVGESRKETIGRNFRELPFIRDQYDLLEERFVSTTAGGCIEPFEIETTVRGGRRASFEIFISLILDGNEPRGVEVIARDITARRVMEEQLLQMQKMDAIGTLAGGIAHDFNNMLTGILGYAELLRELRGDDEEVGQAAEVIEGAARRAAQLTGQLLGFARLGKYRDDRVDTHELVYSALQIIEHSIDKRIVVERRLEADPHCITGDAGQIEQVIVNLALNARDAMPGGGRLVVSTSVVDVAAGEVAPDPDLSTGRHLVLAVSDDGEGMTPEVRERIFDPFFTTRGPEGKTGMGLAMVYGIVKNHEGGIAVESAPGEGTTVRLFFPLREEAESGEPEKAEEEILRGTGRVLVVDDEAVVLRAAARMIEHLGYEAIPADGGEAALDAVRGRPGGIDLVLLDLVMPEMDGEAVIRALKGMEEPPPVLLSSGYGIDGRVQALLEGGAAGFVQKPYVLADLSRAVAEAIGGPPPAADAG
ncbi:MAG: PAS domain S-box protein [Candidatus Krumholzibacteriota bacterium]|nr:PAS domain S-box protein [Candidatus Krumholzibacteriota bacterium]